MTIEFRVSEGGSGIDVVDRSEGRHFPLTTGRSISLESSTSDRFREPVDAAVSCRVEELELPYVVAVYVRDADGNMVAECHDFAHESLPDGEYELEIAAPIKIFVRASGPMTVTSLSDEMHIEFDGCDRIDLAARSYHGRPIGVVTATEAPEDLMAAVSTFGSALSTTSVERSFPSLRGHPPTIELGDSLEIPDTVVSPDTGIRIEIPRDRAAVYAVATLAHYLGARVLPGSDAQLIADGDVVRTLDGPDGLEGAVNETLQRVFLLDCVVRTVGRYEIDLHERRRLEERIALPLEALYEASLAERITEYLTVPAEPVMELMPTWYLSTHLSPEPESAELLSYAANALSLIAVEDFVSEVTEPGPTAPPGYEDFVQSGTLATRSPASDGTTRYVRIPESDSLERAWVGNERSVNANDLHLSGVRNRISNESTDGPIEIAIVCNDERMGAEIGDGDLYGDRDELPFNVTAHRNLSREEFRAVVDQDLDFLHYVGHVERAGIVCRDGALDASELDAVGVDTFLLNGCRSYEQGITLVEKGSVGGIVTHGAVDDPNATTVGRLVAGLLNAGFSLRSALAVAGYRHPVESRYTVVGDGAVQVAQSENGTPNVLTVSREPEGDGYEVRITTYPALGQGMGSCYTPYAPSVDRHFLVGGDLPPMSLSLPEVVNLLALERVPAIIDGEFRWSNDVSIDELP